MPVTVVVMIWSMSREVRPASARAPLEASVASCIATRSQASLRAPRPSSRR